MTDKTMAAAMAPANDTEKPTWLERARKHDLATATALVAASLLGMYILWPTPAPQPIDCTIAKGAALVDCFGTNSNAFKASMQFAERYGLPADVTLISSTLKPADAIKLDGGQGTDVVRVSVPMSAGDRVVVPFDKDGYYQIDEAIYVHQGKVVQPVTR